MTTGELLLSAWDIEPAVGLLSAGALGGYLLRFRRELGRRSLCFFAAVALFFLALASPIGVLSRGYLFSAHMLQHLLLLLAVPPLALLGLPGARDDGAPREASLGHLGPWMAGVGAMWLWHARPLCNAAAVSGTMQALQTASLLSMGLLFWRPILARRAAGRLAPFPAILYLFAACLACTVLGIVVTLSPVEVCSAYMSPVDRLGALPLLRDGWGLSPRNDQELGGVMMWVPTCVVYASAILATLGRYYGEETRALGAAAGARGQG